MALEDGPLHRLFVAVPLPTALEGFVREEQAALPAVNGMRLLRPEQLHVTLAFIGEVGEAKAAAAREVVESVPAGMGGSCLLGGLVMLPSPTRARVVALGIADSGGVFWRLHERVVSGLEARGVMKREKRPFRAHITVARLRYPGVVQPTSESGGVAFAVESVCLYESRLRREGAEYSVVAQTLLEG